MVPVFVSRVALRGPFQRLATANTVSRTGLVTEISRVRAESTRSYSSTMHDNDPEVLEREKQRNLSGRQFHKSQPHENAPGWNEQLASASEAVLKADKSASGNPIELQRTTVEFLRTRNDPENREDSTHAFYPKDEVNGPLQTAEGHESPADDALVSDGDPVKNTK